MSAGLKSYGKKLFLLSAVFTAAAVLCAGEADERKLGDRAFYSEDFATAISHYQSAQKLSEESFFSEPWIKNTLKLGKAQLLSGDIAGAKATLKEFRQRHPLRSAGTLDADILAAEKKFDEAEKLYSVMENSGDSELAVAAAFGRAVMRFEQGKLAEAEKLFREVLPEAEPRMQSAIRRELAYTLIRQEKYADALTVLSEVPDEFRENSHDILKALAEIKSGKLDDFKKNWHELVRNDPRFPDRRCCELLMTAADMFEAQSDRALSAELLKSADRFAASAGERQALLKKLINLESSFDPESAAESAKRYLKTFPDAPDRFQVLTSAARILADSGRFTAGADLLKEFTDGNILPQDIRYQAAVDGAVYAEKAGNIALTSEFYPLAAENAPDDAAKVSVLRKYAAFLMRQKKYHQAVTALIDAVKIDGDRSSDDLKEELLDAAVKDHNAAIITMSSNALKNSSVPRYRGRAHYELAELADKKQDFATARKEYLAAAAIRNSGKYALAGRFGAALAAFKLGDHASCGKEAFQLAAEYPELPQAPQALYLGYRAARMLNDSELKNKCADLLTEKYSTSESYAVYALQNAADRAGANRDLNGAIADLEALEQQFSQLPEIVAEAMLMRTSILRLSGKFHDAVECANLLIARYPKSNTAYYAAMLAGDIHFSQHRYDESLKYFNQAAAIHHAGLENELAQSMAIESMFQSAVNKPEMNEKAIIECSRLIGSSNFAHIRLKMRYRKAGALQSAGRKMEALTGYEQLLNEAVETASKGEKFDRVLCLRGAVAALDIIMAARKRSLYQRGLRIIERCKQLQLDKNGLNLDTLSTELTRRFSSKPKRR